MKTSYKFKPPFFYWGATLPTIRSQYTFEQFRQALQGLAYKIALEAITNMDSGRVTIKIEGSRPADTTPFESARMEEVSTDRVDIKFYPAHAYYAYHDRNKSWSFDLADKQYNDAGGNQSKITYECYEKEKATVEKTILDFMANLMKGATPTPRFSLSQTKP